MCIRDSGLTVTPQITPDDRVILDVFVSQDSWAPGTSQNMNTNQITTQVLLHNGETVIIGGIYNQNLTESVEKIPLLGDLPMLGAFFRQKAVNDQRTELLVFLTPRIIQPINSSNKLVGVLDDGGQGGVLVKTMQSNFLR